MFDLASGFSNGVLALPLADQTVTVTFNINQVITWVIIGIVAGTLASLLVRGRGMHWATSLVIGLIGALLGGFLFDVLRIPIPAALSGGITITYVDIFVAFIGAVILLVLLGGLFYRRSSYRRE